MPFRRTRYTRKRKPAYKRRGYYKTGPKRKGKYNKAITSVMRGPAGIPDRIFAKLKYTSRVVLTSTTGIGYTYQFAGNSMYDPDYTSTGSQPLGFDQWATMYDNYRVNGSKIVLRLASTGTTASTQTMEFALIPTPFQSPYSAIEDARANPMCSFTVANLNSYQPTMKRYCSTRRVFGYDKKAQADQDLQAAVTTNPAKQWYWNLIAQSADRTTTVSIIVYVTMTFYCEFFARKRLALS